MLGPPPPPLLRGRLHDIRGTSASCISAESVGALIRVRGGLGVGVGVGVGVGGELGRLPLRPAESPQLVVGS